MQPKISLALLNYCQAKYLPDSIRAILSQTDAPDEILVFDDASTDNSLDLLKEIPHAKFHFNPTNQGVKAVVDKVIEVSECDYIAIYPADDILHPQFVE